MVTLLLKLAEHIFGFCRNKKGVSAIDLYLINGYDCFKSQYNHIKRCLSSKIDGNKTGILIKEEKGELLIHLFIYHGLPTIANICNNL